VSGSLELSMCKFPAALLNCNAPCIRLVTQCSAAAFLTALLTAGFAAVHIDHQPTILLLLLLLQAQRVLF
jgi:hypothetical protein